MLTDKQIDEFDVIALKEADTPPGVNPSDWMRSFATQVWNAAQKTEREECAKVCDDFALRCKERFGLNGTPEHIAEQCAIQIRERST